MPAHLVLACDSLIALETARALFPPNTEVTRSYGSDLSADDIFNQLSSLDLFATEKGFHYVDIADMRPGPKDAKRIGEVLSSLERSITLVCTQVITATSRREEDRKVASSALKVWTEHSKVHDLRRISEGDQAVRWLRKYALDEFGLALTANQAGLLFESNGESLALASAELRKLAMLKTSNEPQPVPDKLLTTILSQNPQARFYELADALLLAAPDVQHRLSEWFTVEPETFRLVNEMRRRFLAMRTLAVGGQVMPPFFARQMQGFASRWRGRKLDKAVLLVAELEHRLKSGESAGSSSKDAELSMLQMFAADLLTAQGR